MTKQERMQKIQEMQEDRDRQKSLREQREANTNMMKELESVIHLRPQRTGVAGGRVTSL
jgi:CHASE3 domain sensor protein